MSLTTDKRGKLLNHSEIQKWFDSPSRNYRIGFKNAGEFRMGCDAGQFLIETANGDEWINLGNFRFALPNQNIPFIISLADDYLILDWLFWHIHGDMSPVLIHLPSRSYTIIEPRRIVSASGISVISGKIVVMCHETTWKNSKREHVTNVTVKVKDTLKPIQNFFELDPFTIDALVSEWTDDQLKTTPLKEYQKLKMEVPC
jgi:hypothetical protein